MDNHEIMQLLLEDNKKLKTGIAEIKDFNSNINTKLEVFLIKLNNHNERIDNLEKMNIRTIKNCAENIPKIHQVCARTRDIEDKHNKFKTGIIFSLLGIVASFLTIFLTLK